MNIIQRLLSHQNSNTMKKAIVLGGTNPHIEVIKQLHERGYYVILVDFLPNPPAKTYADLHIQESSMDMDKVVEIGREYDVEMVICACIDQQNVTACYASEKLGLKKPYSYELANSITNKGYMKKVMVENGIPTTKFVFLSPNDAIDKTECLRFPVMVKPADSLGSAGVRKANNTSELETYVKQARKFSRTSGCVVEEFFVGKEVSIYSYAQDGKANVLMVSERFSIVDGDKKVLKCFATVTPPEVSDMAMRKMEDAATKIVKAFGLDNTPLHVQCLINGDDIDVIEFAPRVGGGISYRVIKEQTGFDIISAAIDSYSGIKINQEYHKSNIYYSINLLYGKPCIFDHVEGIEELQTKGVIEGFHNHKGKGSELSDEKATACRIGAVLVKGKSRQEMLSKIQYVFEHIDAFNDKGESILRKDLFLMY